MLDYKVTAMENVVKELADNQIKQLGLIEAVTKTNELMIQSHKDFVRRYEQDKQEYDSSVRPKVENLWDTRNQGKGAMKLATVGWSAIGGGLVVAGLVIAFLQLMKTH